MVKQSHLHVRHCPKSPRCHPVLCLPNCQLQLRLQHKKMFLRYYNDHKILIIQVWRPNRVKLRIAAIAYALAHTCSQDWWLHIPSCKYQKFLPALCSIYTLPGSVSLKSFCHGHKLNWKPCNDLQALLQAFSTSRSCSCTELLSPPLS